jgi:hypothetical protein
LWLTPDSEQGGDLHPEAKHPAESDHGPDPQLLVDPAVHVVVCDHYVPAHCTNFHISIALIMQLPVFIPFAVSLWTCLYPEPWNLELHSHSMKATPHLSRFCVNTALLSALLYSRKHLLWVELFSVLVNKRSSSSCWLLLCCKLLSLICFDIITSVKFIFCINLLNSIWLTAYGGYRDTSLAVTKHVTRNTLGKFDMISEIE